jgi:uncharacterized membrane protein
VAAVPQVPKVFTSNLDWMSWNLVLAVVPAVMAVLLFRTGRARTRWWWAGVAAFVLFLPNAPYVLTDVVHFIDDVRRTRSDARVVLWVIPQYAAFFGVGFGAYVVAMWRVTQYVRVEASVRWALVTELALHGLCAVGIFVGRFLRLNSWDVFSDPATVVRRVGGQIGNDFSLAAIAMTFVVISVSATTLRWFFAIRVQELARD